MRNVAIFSAVIVCLCASATAQQVKFGKVASRVGDVTEQSAKIELDVKAVTRQGPQVLDESQIRMRREQKRRLTAMELDASGMVVAARVTFESSRRSAGEDIPAAQVIEGRSYDCRREGEQLHIVCSDGTIPGPEEFRLVSESLDSLGRPNPIAKYFAGRTVTIGQKIALPPEVGAGLMSRDAVGEISRFEVTLKQVTSEDGVQVAQFDTLIETHENTQRQLGLVVTGRLALEVDSCRTRTLDISGPIALAETTGGIGTPTQMHGTGKLRVALEASYSTR
jgi:hypothetical protein